nr:hypothetical protein [Pandoravirus massiliensis]
MAAAGRYGQEKGQERAILFFSPISLSDLFFAKRPQPPRLNLFVASTALDPTTRARAATGQRKKRERKRERNRKRWFSVRRQTSAALFPVTRTTQKRKGRKGHYSCGSSEEEKRKKEKREPPLQAIDKKAAQLKGGSNPMQSSARKKRSSRKQVPPREDSRAASGTGEPKEKKEETTISLCPKYPSLGAFFLLLLS